MHFIKTWSKVGVSGTTAQPNNHCSLPCPLCLRTYCRSYLQINVTHLGPKPWTPSCRQETALLPQHRTRSQTWHALLNPANPAKYSRPSAHVRPYDPNCSPPSLPSLLQPAGCKHRNLHMWLIQSVAVWRFKWPTTKKRTQVSCNGQFIS